MRYTLRRKRDSRRGAALVEFALVVPVLLLFLVGMIEVGRAIMVQQLITNASREGARVAGYESTTQTSSVTSAVNTYLSNVNINGATTTVSPDPPTGASDGQQVSVSVSVPYKTVSWVPSPFFLGGSTLKATSVMRREPAP
ncbi:MAG TPA: TadE/TadG family type IV pilus assembly protein [Pirellulales bacterium]|jgi:Flp pilus assembly protein TadG|nr:TadE/TadG family type IV pilus assembly protein [Pirellulales bacterium]